MSFVDNLIFGEDTEKRPVTYNHVRLETDEAKRIKYLQLRLNALFERKVEPLVIANSAFPLAVMSCIGIETLGEIFFEGSKDDSSLQFVNASYVSNKEFKKKPKSETLGKMQEHWSSDKVKLIKSKGHVLYSFFRNSMVHGFRAQAIYLSYQGTDSFVENSEEGIFIMNPNWLWESYKRGADKLFADAIKGNINKQRRKNCLRYIDKMLKHSSV